MTAVENRTHVRPNLPLTVIFCALLWLFPGVREDTAFALDGADVAIYNDSIAPVDPVTGATRSGVWQDGVTAIKCMLTWMGLSHEEITYHDLNDSSHDLSSLYRVLLFPGGFAYWYNYWISLSGKDRIRSFVNNGGGYFGICAGSFFASDKVVWEGVTYDDDSFYNAYGELTGYDLDLFKGTGTGPINGIAPWPTYEMTTVNFQNETVILAGYKPVPFTEDILYYGGPFFTTDQGADVVALGNYEYNGEPALVAFTSGSGRVVLTGPHPEIEEDSDRDCVTIDREEEMNDRGSDWELALHLFNWIMGAPHPSCPELYSWNGKEYQFAGSLFTRTHSPESEFFQDQMISPVVPQGDTINFVIKEIDREESYVNSVGMFYRYVWAPSDDWQSLPLLSSVHNKDGNVMESLLEKDDKRVVMIPGDEILVQYALPSADLADIEFSSVASGYYLWRHETWCEVMALGRQLHVEPGNTVTLRAYINNMSTEALPDNAVVRFALEDDPVATVGSVSAAGLAPGGSQWYSLVWLAPEDFTAGTYTYQALVFMGESDITWKPEYYPTLPEERSQERAKDGSCN